MSDPETPSSSLPLVHTLDDYLAKELPTLTKRERRRLAARGGIRVNGREVTDVAEAVGERDRVELPPPPGGEKWGAEQIANSKGEMAKGIGEGTGESARRDDRSVRRTGDISKGRDARPARPTPPSRPARPTQPMPPMPPMMPATPVAPPAPPLGVSFDAPRVADRPERQPQFEGRIRQGTPNPRDKRFLARGIRLVYEDDDIIIIDKAPGILTADPTDKNTDTVFDAIKKYMRRAGRVGGRGSDRRGRVWIIHRLDKEASGLLVFTKTSEAFESIKEQFRSKRTDRVYYAAVEGVVGEPGFAGTHQSFLVDAGDDPRVKSIATASFRGTPGKEARLAVTHYRVVASNPDVLAGTGASLLQVRLDTGRKNQIRAHMTDIGHPIVGDQRYGAVTDPLGRVALHAADLSFTHPRTGRSVRFSSPPPGPFYRCVGMKPVREDEGDEGDAPGAKTPAPARAPAAPTRVGQSEVDTSWDRVAAWYDDLISEKQNDHYEEVIMPGTLRLIQPYQGMRLLDVACGQGVLSRRLATLGVQVTGVDASPQLIGAARGRGASVDRNVPTPVYVAGDVRELGRLGLTGGFDAAACVMALGNIEPLEPVFRGVAGGLREGGSFTFVVAHPAFRAPGQTSWGWDETERKQYRRVEGYLSTGQRAIQMHPGRDSSVVTWTFHRPLQAYAKVLAETGFGIEMIEEWVGKRVSTSGPRAAEENRIRREIPLFLAVRAVRRGSRV